MKLKEDLNNLAKKYQRGGLKRLLDEENSSDSNSTINYTKLRNINPTREIKKQTQKIENVQKKNNVSRKKALEIIQKEEFDKNVSMNPQSVGEIAPVEDQSIASKTWEVLTNPVTAASYWLNDQRIPDRFSKGERNNLDIATDLFNPFGIVDSAKNAVKETINLPKNLYDGEYGEAGSNFLNAGINTLSVVPALRELKGVKPSNIKNTLTDVEKYLTTKTPLKDTYKINPWAFKPNPDSHYRQIFINTPEGKKMFDVMNDERIIQSPMQAYLTEAENTKNWIDDAVMPSYKDSFILDTDNGKFPFQTSKLKSPSEFPFFQKGRPYYGHRRGTSNPNTILIESKPSFHDDMVFQPAAIDNLVWGDNNDVLLNITGGKTVNIHPNGETVDKFNVYKKDWLKGYKQIEIPKDSYNLENARPSLVDDFSESFGLLGRSAKRFAKTLPIKLLPGHSNRAEKALELGNNWNRDWYNNPITQDRLNNVINHSNFLERIDWKNMQEAIKDEAYISHFQSNLGKISRFLDGKSHFHDNNMGFSVTKLKESLDPMAPLNKNGTQSFVDKYQPPSEIKYTAIHEGNHNLYSNDSFSGSIFSSMLNKNPQKPLRNIPANKLAGYDNYLSTPEEIYARIQEIRAENKLAPGELLTDKMVDEIFNKGLSGKSNVDSRFYQLIDKDKFKKVVNVVPAVGAVGIGASTVSEKKLGGYRKSLDNLVEKRQSGGITDIEKNTTKDKVNQSKQFMLEYINSPKYLERLRKEYPDADEETIKRVYEDRKANFKNSSDNLSIVKKIDNEADSVLGVQYSRENDFRVDPKYQYKIHDKKAGKIEITEKGLKANPHVVTHEISHGITDGTSKIPTKTIIDIIKRTRGNKPEGFDPEGYARKFSDGFFKNEEKLLDSLISIDNDIETHSKKSDAISKANEYFENLDNYSPFSTAEVNTQFNNILYDINGVDGYSKRPTVTDYTSNPTEYLARMQSLRQELKNQGIYDASKEDFTEDHFNKFEKFILDTGPDLLRDQYPDLYEFINATKGSNSFKQPSYKKDIDEDIKKGSDTFKENMIWMMNNVAKNTQKNNNIVYSKKGGEIRNSLNNISKKFF